jgi:hypothetical protein
MDYEELIHQLEEENAELRKESKYWQEQAIKFMARLTEVIYWYEGDAENVFGEEGGTEECKCEEEEEEEEEEDEEEEDEEETKRKRRKMKRKRLGVSGGRRVVRSGRSGGTWVSSNLSGKPVLT